MLLPLLITACGSRTPSPAPGSFIASSAPSAVGAARTLDPDSPFNTTPEQYAIGLKACLEERGFDVDVDPYDWHLTFNLAGPQSGEMPAALAACRNEIDPSRDPARPLPTQSAAQLRALYAYYVDELECLRAAGYHGVDAPPEQVFVDQSGLSWNPRGSGEEDIPTSVVRSCERLPSRPNFLDW